MVLPEAWARYCETRPGKNIHLLPGKIRDVAAG